MVKSSDCSCRGSRFYSQHLDGGSHHTCMVQINSWAFASKGNLVLCRYIDNKCIFKKPIEVLVPMILPLEELG